MVITPGFQPGDDGSIPFTRSTKQSLLRKHASWRRHKVGIAVQTLLSAL